MLAIAACLVMSTMLDLALPQAAPGISDGSVFPFDGIVLANGDVHDPSILDWDGTYVMVHTSGNSFVPIRTSRNLTEWKDWGPILSSAPNWLQTAIPTHRSTWAPAPLRLGKMLRIYYCASAKFGENTSYIWMAENPTFDPAHPCDGWVDRGKFIESKAGESNYNAIDPDVLVGPDARQWIVYGSYWSGIYLNELDPTTGLLKDPHAAPIHVASNTGDRGNPLEAPALVYRDGYYYLFVTYGLAAQGVRSTYRMVCGRSKSPTGPYLGFDGKPMTDGGHTDLLKTSPPMFGPGGGNFFQDPKGEWWMAYHYYDGRRNWHGDVWGRPTLQVRRLLWGEDGWPVPGMPAGAELSGRYERAAGTWTHQADFSDTAQLTFDRDGTISGGVSKGTWSQSGNELKLQWPRADAPGEFWVDTLHLDATGQYYVGRNQAGLVIRGIRTDAKTSR
jgi:arabinan endo-1,5-alpha-L-arabinosidase